eukprot:m.48105 g.48105  ORF g.48105 m.48105 type:complete len:91 (+) comp13267_c0_seq1:397-669(+)
MPLYIGSSARLPVVLAASLGCIVATQEALSLVQVASCAQSSSLEPYMGPDKQRAWGSYFDLSLHPSMCMDTINVIAAIDANAFLLWATSE